MASDARSRRLAEFLGLLSFGLSLMLLISLGTYNPATYPVREGEKMVILSTGDAFDITQVGSDGDTSLPGNDPGNLPAPMSPAKVSDSEDCYDNESLVVGRLAQVNPRDIVVMPVANHTGQASLPLSELRRAFQEGLVLRRYSPLSLEYVDSHLDYAAAEGSEAIEASYPVGSLQEGAVLQIAINTWDDSAWRSHGRLTIQADVHLLDAAGHGLRHDHGAGEDEEELVARVARAEEHLALAQTPLAQARPEGEQHLFVHVLEDGDQAQEGDVRPRGH